MVFYSSVIGGVCLLIALLLRNRSYKQSAERMKTTIIKTLPNASPEQVDEIYQAVIAQDDDNLHFKNEVKDTQ